MKHKKEMKQLKKASRRFARESREDITMDQHKAVYSRKTRNKGRSQWN